MSGGDAREVAAVVALDGADLSADHIVALLDGIPGALERANEGVAQAARGEGIPLDELA